MEHTFDTPEPIELYVELGKGSLTVDADDVASTTVLVAGRHADQVTVEQDGRHVRVLAPRQRTGFLTTSDSDLDVEVRLPAGSELVTRLGSADQRTRGPLGQVRLKSGSGDVELERVDGHAVVDTGSGDITVRDVGGELRVKSGSGDVQVGRVAGNAGVSTGSGDVSIETTAAAAVLKSGSGDLHVGRAEGDLSMSTASGDVSVGTQLGTGVNARNVSGDVRIGVPSGIPVWTDVSTVTGRIGSNLEGAGQPAPGEPYLEIRATTVSGDITLRQV